MKKIDIQVKVDTGLYWEYEKELKKIDTYLYKEVYGGIITLFCEYEEDIPLVTKDLQEIAKRLPEIRKLEI